MFEKLIIIVSLLPSAEHIIALGSNGEIVEQGSFAQLNAKFDGYIRSFALSKSTSPIETESTVASHKFEKSPRSSEEPSNNTKRQVGDMAVYLYYFKAIGFWSMVWFFMGIISCTTILNFPCESNR